MNRIIHARINGADYTFETTDACFSPRYVDRGTLALLSRVTINPGDKLLDLGCGYGVAGIAAAAFTDPANVYMSDTDAEALACAYANAQKNGAGGVHIILSDAYDGLDEAGFDVILSNPPYQTDFSTPKKFIEKGFNRLKLGGRFYMVTKRKTWYKNKFISVFGGVTITEIDGYFVFEAEKRGCNYANDKISRKKRPVCD